MPTPVLALIVKNEAATIRQTLSSARAALGPGVTVVHDTGSTDDTIAAVQAWASGYGGRVMVATRPFDDFSSARNALLEHAWEGGPLVCMVDAGVVVTGTWAPERKAGAYTVEVRLGTCTYTRPQVFTRGWRYVGRVHEYAEAGPGALASEARSGLTFAYSLRDDARARRWLRDLTLLEDDATARGRFYYAQTLECLGRRTQAAEWYAHVYGRTDGWWQERVVAAMRMVPLVRTLAEARTWCANALAVDPSRGDAWLALAARLIEAKAWAEAYAACTKAIMLRPRTDALFARTDREWLGNALAADAAAGLGKYALAREHREYALALGGADVPEDEREALALCVEAAKAEGL